MRKKSAFLFILQTLAISGYGLTPSRSYDWTFQQGNYLPNWSFENLLEGWEERNESGVTANSRFKAAGSPISSAKTGAFVGMAGRAGNGASVEAILSPIIPLQQKANAPYTLSFYYRTTGSVSGTVRPIIYWHTARNGGGSTSFSCSNLSSQGSWTLYTHRFTLNETAQSLQIVLAEFGTNATGTFYFENVVLEDDTLTTPQVQANRQRISESVIFSDALGRTLQSQTKITAAGDKYLVAGTGFDNFARPETTFLARPYSISAPAHQSGLLSQANAYFGSSGPFNANGYAFSRVRFGDEPSSPIVESSTPDAPWQFGNGHTVKRGFYFTNTADIPPNIESPSTNAVECIYRVDWTKSQDSSYALTWTNKLGQLFRQARNVTRTSSGANTWKWAVTRFEYHPDGRLKRTLTPLDDSAGTTHFAEISHADAMGNPISSYSPDRNLRKFWYNRQGQLRYSQDEEQRAGGEYTYLEYDAFGRLISQGVQVTGSLPQDSVDKDVYSQGTKIEQIGYIYDDTATFQARTGFTLQEILGSWKSYIDVRNAPGRLLCSYNRNADNLTPKFTAKQKFVANFHAYDARGLLGLEIKYLGAIKDTLKRLQDIWYEYDAQGRSVGFLHYSSISESSVSNAETFSYDFLGRPDTIRGDGGRMLARYRYAEWGPLDKVTLGGLASGDSSVEMSYLYNSQLGTKEIQAIGRYGGDYQSIFHQFLGYNTKGYNVGGVPALTQPRYDGTIAQQVYKYSLDMNNQKPLRAVNYGYDALGRMGTAQAYWNTNATPLDSHGDINGGALTMGATDSLSSRFDYDLNGRIKGQRSAGVSSGDSARYVYLTQSYKLDKVTGKVSTAGTRNMSANGTFVYDENGALIRDKSKKLNVAYGWDGLPVSFKVDSVSTWGALRCCNYKPGFLPMAFRARYPSLTQYNFYDAAGNRVSRVEVESKKSKHLKTRSTHYVHMAGGMLKEWHEEYHIGGRVKDRRATVSLIGRGAVIGRIRSDGKYEFFVKNHLGSTMLTVDDRGRYSDGRAHDYLAYGSYKDLKVNGADPVTQKFTGKEFEVLTGLYAFGARWHDPELGMWMSPDPAGEFFNPYSYVGGDVANSIDPYGLWKVGVGVVFGWNKRDGWSIGLGVAADDINLGLMELNTDFSYSLNSNGSQTTSIQAGGSVCVGVCAGAQAGGSYNTKAGYSASYSANVGVGLTTYLQVGLEYGTNQYWTTGGDYIGGDVFGGAYAQAIARVSAGYSHGFGAIESGFYANASLFGVSGGYHSAQGWNTGFTGTAEVAYYDSEKGLGSPIHDLKREIDKQHALDNSTAALPLALIAAAPIYTPYLVSAATAIGGLITGSVLGVAAKDWYASFNEERDVKNAERELRTNTDFRRWFHREFKPHNKPPGGPRKNPDLDGPAILEAWRQYNGY